MNQIEQQNQTSDQDEVQFVYRESGQSRIIGTLPKNDESAQSRVIGVLPQQN